MYTIPDSGNMDTYMMQGTELHHTLTPGPVFDNVSTMTSDGASAYVVDPGLYYPGAAGYGYYCTGFEAPSEWDDSSAVFGLDGADVQYAGSQTEGLPYVCYSPSYGYGEASFNPYNPYIPGAMVGVDGTYAGTQPYYTVLPYHNPVSSPGYFPVLVQPGSDIVASSSSGGMADIGRSSTHYSSTKHTYSSTPTPFPLHSSKASAIQASSLTKGSQKVGTGTSKHPLSNQTSGSSGSPQVVSSHVSKNGTGTTLLPSGGNISCEKHLPYPMKLSFPDGGRLSEFTPRVNGQAVLNDPWSKFYYRSAFNDGIGSSDQLGEQNRGPRTNKSQTQFVVKSYTMKAGDSNQDGNIVISADQYNKDDFPLDYMCAKFFVIKSYSEDDVHKSIKYNVWSSTPNGNKKLNSAYEDAQRIAAGKSRGCPVFLFFSVNASGQFCGVAEMVGPVDFDRDMDFWHQDKWSGNFPVKWHFIKDVPNPSLRHIILENNEHKPVTNSRDTQEIMARQGMEVLKIFKSYSSKTSLLDDFMYYEERQRIIHEERARLLRKSGTHSHTTKPFVKLNSTVEQLRDVDEMSTWVEKGRQPNNSSSGSEKGRVIDTSNADVKGTSQTPMEDHVDGVATLKIGSLSIHPKHSDTKVTTPPPSAPITAPAMPIATGATSNVVTVGSMPIKVDGARQSFGMLSIGTIPLDPKTLQTSKTNGFANGSSRK